MKQVKKLMAAMGSYTDRQGQEKTRWVRIGTMLKADNGKLKLKIDAMPVGSEFNGWVELFDIDDQQKGQQQAPAPAPQADDFSDDIPF